MKNHLLGIMAVSLLVASQGVGDENKPHISICEPSSEQCDDVGIEQWLKESSEKVSRLTHADPVTLKSLDELISELRTAYHIEKNLTQEDVQKICSAIDFAAEKHRLQTRKNEQKTPYISHPIGVAYNVMHYGEVRDANIIIGALLHDTVEDTQTTFEEISKQFGPEVSSYVRELTDDKSLGSLDRKRAQVIEAANKSNGAAQIKLADKLYNVNDLLHNPPKDWSQTRIDRYYQWAQSVIDRLPSSNKKLKKAVEDVINHYWKVQESKKIAEASESKSKGNTKSKKDTK
jgi:(p)ppGpp synthase/HD superfamily hydrolase